ncbi:MAG TPA: LLM class flavin-dependent oxidoreductase, partial [Yinghuangia sp.]|nr:LLM class flavin-dependent oxidoreductase [Yinghuangia sp.]
PDQLAELLGYFTGDQTVHPGVHARPAEGLRPAPFVLATGEGAGHAARAGLPLVMALFGAEERTLRAIDEYRALFRPSEWAREPYVVIAGSVAVADTEQEAEELLVPEAWSAAYARTHGVFPPLMPAREIRGLTMTAKERTYLADGLRGHVRGTEQQVEAELERILPAPGADEFMLTTSTFDRSRMTDTYTRLARMAGLAATVG